MTGFRFELIGKEALLRKLDKGNFKKPIAGSIRKITLWYHRTAQAATPVDMNRLRPSVSAKYGPDSGQVFTNVEYAPYVEYGTHKMEARHVERGSAARIKGKDQGPFTWALRQLHDQMGQFLGELAKGIKVRFD